MVRSDTGLPLGPTLPARLHSRCFSARLAGYYNTRGLAGTMQRMGYIVAQLVGKRLTYKELTA